MADVNAGYDEVSAIFGQWRRVVLVFAALLTVLPALPVHWLKKLSIGAGFDNLNTDGHG